MRRKAFGFFFDLTRRFNHGRPTHCQAAAAIGAVTKGGACGVGVLNQHAVVGDTQLIGHNLRKGGFDSLTVGQRAGGDDHLTGQVNAHIGAFPETSTPPLAIGPGRRCHTTDFDIRANPDAEIAALGAERCLLFAQVGISHIGQCFVERWGIVATVIRQQAEAVVVGELSGGDEVAAAYFRRIHA